MGETEKSPETPDNSGQIAEEGDTDPDGNTEDEQKPSDEDAEGGSGESDATPAEEPAEETEETEDTEDTTEAPEDTTEAPEETEDSEESPAETEDKPLEQIKSNSSINSAEAASTTIEVKQYQKDGTTKEDGSKEDKLLQGDEAAEVTFIDGTSSDGKNALGGERPVKFILDPKAGWKSGVTVKYTIAKGGDVTDDKTETISAANGVYTVPTNVAAKAASGDTAATPAAYSGNITISITAESVKSTLKLGADASSGEKVYLAAADGTPNTEKEISKSAGQDLDYAQSTADVTVAVSGLDKNKKYHSIKVKTGADGAEEATVTASGTKAVTKDGAETTYTLFTFKPSELDGFGENTDTEVAITLQAGAEAHGLDLALAADASTKWKAGKITLTDTSKDYITVKDDGTAFSTDGLDPALTEDTLTTGEGAAAKERVLAFTVTPQGENMLVKENPVTAELTGEDGKTVKTVNAEFVAKAGETDAYYKVGLAQFANSFTGAMTLTIKAATEIDPDATGVHSLKFEGDLENATVGIKNGDALQKKDSYLAKADSVTFGVAPKAGYTLKKGTDYRESDEGGNSDKEVVTVSYEKVYVFNKKAADGQTPEKVKAVVKVTDEEITVTQTDGEGPYYAPAFKFENEDYKDEAWKDADNKLVGSGTPVSDLDGNDVPADGKATYTKENVVVTVKTELKSSGAEGTVTIESRDADYTLEGDGVIKIGSDKYRLSEETALLTLNITSDVKPSVTGSNGEGADFEVTGDAGSYICVIPVSLLKTDGDGIVDDTITIAKAGKSLTFTSVTDDGEDEDDPFNADVEINGRVPEYLDALTYAEGEKVNVILRAKTGTEFSKVTTLSEGDDSEEVEEEVELGEDKSSVSFTLTMSKDMCVKAMLKSVYDAKVTVDGDELDYNSMKEGAYVIPSGSENITVTLVKGEDEAEILYAKVYDGDATADTTATVSGAKATIGKISDKDTGVLRVELASKQTKKVEASVQISQEKAAARLTVKDAKNKAVTAASLMADSEITYTVEAADGGRLDFAKDNIDVEVVSKADDAVPATATRENDAVKAAYDPDEHTLTITAKPSKTGKDAAAVVRLYAKAERTAAASNTAAEDKLCLLADPITVKTTDPSIVGVKPTVKEATGSDKTLKVELSTPDKVVKPLTAANKVYYKVDITGTLSTGINATQYFEKTAWGKNSQIATIVVDNSTVDANGVLVEGSAKDYSLKVELVQTTNGAAGKTVEQEATEDTLARGGDNAVAELNKISTRDPLYETKLTMKPASVTVYTGQGLTKVTQAQFNKKTGYTVAPYVQFVNTKTGVLLSGQSGSIGEDGLSSTAAYYGSYTAKVDINGNVYIANSASMWNELPKDIGLKVTAEYPEGAYAATAIVKITTVRGIHSIDFASGGYRTLYKQSGKPASMKLTPVLNEGYKETAPKKKNLTYAMGDAEGNLSGDRSYSLNAELASKVKVNPKNGAVTVDKNFKLSDNGYENTFTVVAQAADYAGNSRKGVVTVEITGTPQELGDVVIVDENNKVIARDGGTLKAEDFYEFDEFGDVDYYHYLQVKVLKKDVASKRVYADDDFVYGVSYASGTKAALAVDTVGGVLRFVKSNKKPVKLTVTNGDGSKKTSKSISVNLKGYDGLGLWITGDEADNGSANVKDVTYDGAMNARFRLYPAVLANGYWQSASRLEYANMTVKVTGAKTVSKAKNGVYWLDIVMTSSNAKILLTDKTDKTVKAEYTITQDPAAAAKAKAPSIKQIGKLTAQDVQAAKDGDGKQITFQVTNKNSDPQNHARQYVLLTPDYTKTKSAAGYSDWYEYQRASAYFLEYKDTKIVQIGDDGRFSLDLDWSWFDADSDIYPGSYALIATVGTYKEGKFVPEAKGVNVKIAIPGKAIKNNLTVKGKYTLDPSATAPVDLASGNNIVTDFDWDLTNAPSERDTQSGAATNYAMNKIDPKTGKANDFIKYFEVKRVGGTYKLGLKQNLTADELNHIMDKAGAADREGYVTVTTYNGDGDELLTKDMKITVTFKDTKPVAKTLQPSVYANGASTTATVQIFETAKSTEPMALVGAVVSDDSNVGATLSTGTGVEGDGKTLKLTLASAAAGTYKVNLKVLMADSGYANMQVSPKDYQTLAKEWGRAVTATIKVSDKGEGTKNKVSIDIDNVGKNKKNFKIASTDFVSASNSYINYDVNVESQIEGANITGAATPADYEGKDILTAALSQNKKYVIFTLKRDKLIEANAARGGKFKFGKAVDVPVEFTFDNSVASETVTFKITLPNPMTFEKAVEAATRLEPVITAMKADRIYDMYYYDEAKVDLEERIRNTITNAIPQDAQAVVPEFSLTDVDGTGEQVGQVVGYKGTLNVQKAQTKAEGDYSKEYTFNVADELEMDVVTLASAIESLTEATDYAQLGNSYTADLLLADIKAQLKDAGTNVGDNLLLKVKSFKLKKATAAKSGEVWATIEVRDRRYFSLYDQEGFAEAELDLTIEKLGTLADASKAVKNAVKETDDNGKIVLNYNEVISTALGTGDTANKAAVEGALKTAIEKAAKAAITNPDITVTGFEKITKDADGDNPATVEGADEVKVDVDFKLPTGSTAGWVAFKLVLHQDGMKDLTVDCTGSNKISVTAKSLGTMTIAGKDVTEETPRNLTITDDKVSMIDVDGAKKLTFSVAFTGSQFLTAADEKVVWELVKEATATGDATLDTIEKETVSGVTVTPATDGKSATVEIAANAPYGAEDNMLTLYLRAKKDLTKLYASDEDAIKIDNRTKIITIELTKKAAVTE